MQEKVPHRQKALDSYDSKASCPVTPNQKGHWHYHAKRCSQCPCPKNFNLLKFSFLLHLLFHLSPRNNSKVSIIFCSRFTASNSLKLKTVMSKLSMNFCLFLS